MLVIFNNMIILLISGYGTLREEWMDWYVGVLIAHLKICYAKS